MTFFSQRHEWKDNASFASRVSAFESSGSDIRLQQTSDQKVAYVFVRFNEIIEGCETIVTVLAWYLW